MYKYFREPLYIIQNEIFTWLVGFLRVFNLHGQLLTNALTFVVCRITLSQMQFAETIIV